ncbi:MAG TPA: helix-turn-helix transcriptional regulator, partial [Stellaceae bacterium]|jgi:transcriptional regulator with XRE-family HTH domain|nr:helix-turn-helix transcriptional regulator [Stellaceae bacterium]
MAKRRTRRQKASTLVRQLLQLDLDGEVRNLVEQIHQRLALPMSEVLGKVPGENLSARAREVGVSRQTYYQWLREETRPNPVQAVRLAELTGFPEHQIRGRPEQ